MIRTLMTLVAVGLLCCSVALGDVTTLLVYPGMVPSDGEQQPRAKLGDAPTGFGPDSWQGPATGKSNWNARYLTDGDYLSAMFPANAATLTIADLASVSYFTERPAGTAATRDWWVQIYTRPTGSGDKSSWYHDRFINNYGDHTAIDEWTQYSTDTGMTFHSNGLGVIGNVSLAGLIAAAGSQQIEMFSVQTNSAWNGFDGCIDGLVVTLNNGNVGRADFVPEPGTLVLLVTAGLGALAFAWRRRQS
jgi:hypothetical protein